MARRNLKLSPHPEQFMSEVIPEIALEAARLIEIYRWQSIFTIEHAANSEYHPQQFHPAAYKRASLASSASSPLNHLN